MATVIPQITKTIFLTFRHFDISTFAYNHYRTTYLTLQYQNDPFFQKTDYETADNLTSYFEYDSSMERLEVECGPNKAYLFIDNLCQGSKGKCIDFKVIFLCIDTPNYPHPRYIGKYASL